MRHINIYIFFLFFFSQFHTTFYIQFISCLRTINITNNIFYFFNRRNKFNKPSWLIIIFKICAQQHIQNNVPHKGKLNFSFKNISFISLFVALSSVIENILSVIPQYWCSSLIRFAMLYPTCGDSKILSDIILLFKFQLESI